MANRPDFSILSLFSRLSIPDPSHHGRIFQLLNSPLPLHLHSTSVTVDMSGQTLLSIREADDSSEIQVQFDEGAYTDLAIFSTRLLNRDGIVLSKLSIGGRIPDGFYLDNRIVVGELTLVLYHPSSAFHNSSIRGLICDKANVTCDVSWNSFLCQHPFRTKSLFLASPSIFSFQNSGLFGCSSCSILNEEDLAPDVIHFTVECVVHCKQIGFELNISINPAHIDRVVHYFLSRDDHWRFKLFNGRFVLYSEYPNFEVILWYEDWDGFISIQEKTRTI